MGESILCIRRETLDSIVPPTGFHGIKELPDDAINRILQSVEVVERSKELESDASLCQLVAYGVVQCDTYVLTYMRMDKHSQSSLSGKTSIGIGGHIKAPAEGVEVNQVYLSEEMLREFFEEVDELAITTPKLVGIINDPYEAGLYHVGFVFLIQGQEPFNYKLSDEAQVAWLINSERIDPAAMEPWSTLSYCGIFLRGNK